MTFMEFAVRLRRASADDLAKITKTWMYSYKDHGAPSMPMRDEAKKIFSEKHWAVVSRCLRHENVMVLCSEESPDLIQGWICAESGEEKILHYVHVSGKFRRFGLGRFLLTQVFGAESGSRIISTHYTWMLKELCRSMDVKVDYDPYLVCG